MAMAVVVWSIYFVRNVYYWTEKMKNIRHTFGYIE